MSTLLKELDRNIRIKWTKQKWDKVEEVQHKHDITRKI